MATERRYQLVRIQPGDYCVLSNDGRTLWRITRYHEDGSLTHYDGTVVRGDYWSAWRFEGTPEQAQRLVDVDPDAFLAWDRWREWASLFPTRAAALADALEDR